MAEEQAAVEPDRYIVNGAEEIFSTMLMMEVGSTVLTGEKSVDIVSNITSMIGLGGRIRGMLAVHCPAETARRITSSFLGMEVTELDDDVKDAIGEIANMMAGNLKESFAGGGVDIELAIPTSTIGDTIKLRGVAGATRHLVAFTCDAGPFWVELLYMAS